MTIFSKNLGGRGHFPPPGYAYVYALSCRRNSPR